MCVCVCVCVFTYTYLPQLTIIYTSFECSKNNLIRLELHVVASQKRIDLAGGQTLLSRRPARLDEHELLLVGFGLLFEALLLLGGELRGFRGETLRREELRRLRLEGRSLLLELLLLLLLPEQVLRLLEHGRLLLLGELLLLQGRGLRENGAGPLEVEFYGSLWLELRLELGLERLERRRSELLLLGRIELRRRSLLELRLRLPLSRGQRKALVDVDAGRLFGPLLEHDRVVLAGGRVEHQFGGVQRRVRSGRNQLRFSSDGRGLRQVPDGRFQVLGCGGGRSEWQLGRCRSLYVDHWRYLWWSPWDVLQQLLLTARLAWRRRDYLLRLRLRLRLWLFEIAERLLEQRGGGPILLELLLGAGCDHRYVSRNVLFFARFSWLLVVVIGRHGVGVARVPLDVREFPFVTVRIHVTVLAPDHAIRSPGLLLETTVVRLVTERERTVVVQFVVIPDRLGRGLLLLLRLFLEPSLLDELLRRWLSAVLLRRPGRLLLSDEHRLLFATVVVFLLRTLLQQPGRLPDDHDRLTFRFHIGLLRPMLQRSPGDQHRFDELLLLIVSGRQLLGQPVAVLSVAGHRRRSCRDPLALDRRSA